MSPIPDAEKWIQGYVDPSTVEIAADSNGKQYSKFKGTILVPYPGSSPSQDEFEGGNLYFKIFTGPMNYYYMGASGGGPFRITRSKNIFGCKFEIWPPLSATQLSAIQGSAYGVYFKAQDDADYEVFNNPVTLSIGALKDAFAVGYVDAVYADDFNVMSVAPFKREVSALDLISTMLGSRDLSSSAELWVTHVVASFEGHPSLFLGITDVDLDSDGVVNPDLNGGISPYDGAAPYIGNLSFGVYGISSPANTSAIFMEVFRDANASINQTKPLKLDHITAHEIGHTIGSLEPHRNAMSNLMNQDPDIISAATTFLPQTLDHMRSISAW
jgi:hypothetical protein